MSTIPTPAPEQVAAAGQQANALLAQAGIPAEVDFDKMRAARWEAAGFKQIRSNGRSWDLVPELPLEAGTVADKGDLAGFFDLILAPEQPRCALVFVEDDGTQRFPTRAEIVAEASKGWTIEDLQGLFDLYGLSAGEAQPSNGS